jgi:hypothetical protein
VTELEVSALLELRYGTVEAFKFEKTTPPDPLFKRIRLPFVLVDWSVFPLSPMFPTFKVLI